MADGAGTLFPFEFALTKFFLGILVAPVFDDSGNVEIYLPEGKWTNFWTDEVIHGPRW